MNNKTSNIQAAIIIPARMASTRFPNKPLAKIHGVTMIERVWKIAKACQKANHLIIATDSPELQHFVSKLGAKVVMTSESCKTGTDRVAEAVNTLPDDVEIIFNLQGDAL